MAHRHEDVTHRVIFQKKPTRKTAVNVNDRSVPISEPLPDGWFESAMRGTEVECREYLDYIWYVKADDDGPSNAMALFCDRMQVEEFPEVEELQFRALKEVETIWEIKVKAQEDSGEHTLLPRMHMSMYGSASSKLKTSHSVSASGARPSSYPPV